MRPEFLALLPHANLQSKDIITLSDLPEKASITAKLLPEKTQWILVDHNALQGFLGTIYEEHVGGVIDHHEEDNKVPTDTVDEARIVQKAGSCTSLVVNYCRESWESFTGEGTSILDAQLAKLAMASILIDTTNLQSKAKVTPDDEEAIEYLEELIAAGTGSSQPFDRTAFFNEINRAKSDIGSVKLQDILRKDYKQWLENGHRIGISSVVKPISFLQRKAGEEEAGSSKSSSLLQTIDRFANHRELGLYALMTTSTSAAGQFQRELMVKTFTDDDAKAVKKFAYEASEGLGLEDWDSQELDNVSNDKIWSKVWWQRHVEHSRKRVAPLLREAVR